MTDRPTPIACSLDADDFRDRMAWIGALNRQHLADARRYGHQLVLTYGMTALPRVRDLMAKESACCAFLAFDLTEVTDGVRLTVCVPEQLGGDAELLLAPFQSGTEPLHDTDAGPLKPCGACW